MITTFLKTTQHAFTLSELLISLSVLGLISALTLPGVFNTINETKKKAVLKETITTLAQATQQESNNAAKGMTSIDFIKANMNVATCDTNMTITNPTDPFDRYGCTLQNGVFILHLDKTFNTTQESVLLDWNGNAAPNTLGNDRIVVWFNWGATPVSNTTDGTTAANLMGNPAELRPGEILPRIADATMYTNLYK